MTKEKVNGSGDSLHKEGLQLLENRFKCIWKETQKQSEIQGPEATEPWPSRWLILMLCGK